MNTKYFALVCMIAKSLNSEKCEGITILIYSNRPSAHIKKHRFKFSTETFKTINYKLNDLNMMTVPSLNVLR